MTRRFPLSALILLAGLSACATPVPDRGVEARTPTEHYKATAEARPEEIRLAVHAQGLSTTQATALAQFAATWSNAEGGQITLWSPVGGPDAQAAFRTGEGARTFLIAQGVPADRIAIQGYDAQGDVQASLRVGYMRYEAVVPKCGQAWQNISHSRSNDVQQNFGCAVTANLAAQIANPADLVRPREMSPADASRRLTVLEKYRKGEVVSSAKDAQAQGVISNAIK